MQLTVTSVFAPNGDIHLLELKLWSPILFRFWFSAFVFDILHWSRFEGLANWGLLMLKDDLGENYLDLDWWSLSMADKSSRSKSTWSPTFSIWWLSKWPMFELWWYSSFAFMFTNIIFIYSITKFKLLNAYQTRNLHSKEVIKYEISSQYNNFILFLSSHY